MYSLLSSFIYIGFQNVFLRSPTPRLHCFLSSHWPSFRLLSSMAFLVPFIQFFFRLPLALFCFGIHFNANYKYKNKMATVNSNGNYPVSVTWCSTGRDFVGCVYIAAALTACCQPSVFVYVNTLWLSFQTFPIHSALLSES